MLDLDITTNLNKNRYFRNLLTDRNLILSVILIFLAWAIVYLLLFYRPAYKSQAKVWIKNLATEEFVTALDTQSQLTPLTQAGNPLLTQMEILDSDQLKRAIVDYKAKQGKKISVKSIKIKVKNRPNTDILDLTYKGSSPEDAQQTLQEILKNYEDINLAINKKIKTSRREYIDLKLNEISEKLLDIRSQLKTYRTKNLSIDIVEQSRQLVDQQVFMTTKLADTRAELKNKNSSVAELQNQLSLSTKEAVNAAALGSNEVLIQLRKDLNTAVQEYQFDSAKLADTNPKMIAHKNKIKAINEQIKKQMQLSIGKYAASQKINIFDPVREDMVKKLSERRTELMGLQASERAIQNSLKQNAQEISKVPENKFNLDNLEQEELVLSEAYKQLKEKQIEAKIKEAEAVSNIVVVDTPSLPEGASFPTGFQTLILAVFFGTFAGLFVSILKTYLEDVCENTEAIEEITGTSLIGTIPWIDPIVENDQLQNIYSLAYDNIVSNLMIKSFKDNKKVITFTSSSLKKTHPTRIYQVATRLRKAGHSVVVLDCDFRIPTIFKTANIEDKVKINLSELIVNLEQKIHQANEEDENKPKNANVQELLLNREIRSSLTADEQGILYLGNKEIILEPCEFFGTVAFGFIIKFLREKYDWVLIDTGVAQITPEFLIISKLSDGVVLLVNKTITYTTLQTITKSLKNANIPFIGAIVRETESKLADDYKKFLNLQQDNASTNIGA